MVPTAQDTAPKLTKKDYQSDQEVRWCPGCGDFAILNATLQVFAQLGFPREKMVMVSGIGCSSRFPYYVKTYGFHSIHGRAMAIATGVKLANPELQVWVFTGDGDGLSIGGNHFVHTLRRNTGLKIILFNNRIYGLTKGQYSPTSSLGMKNKTAPYGTVDQPVNPISLALASEATFVARSVDVYTKHLMEMIRRMATHEGAAFLEVMQNCVVFNDRTFEHLTEKDARGRFNLYLEHGKPLVFGENKEFGVRLNGVKLEIVRLGEDGVAEKDLVVHDEANAPLAYLISRMVSPSTRTDISSLPENQRFPLPLGVFRSERLPTLEERIDGQIAEQKKLKGEGDLRSLLVTGDSWEVK